MKGSVPVSKFQFDCSQYASCRSPRARATDQPVTSEIREGLAQRVLVELTLRAGRLQYWCGVQQSLVLAVDGNELLGAREYEVPGAVEPISSNSYPVHRPRE